ncbi:MAG TPA: PA2169 family four-helix-bundle protein [Chthoniobacterales bacterium]
MSTTTTSLAVVLNSLLQTCKDGEEGFRSAADNATDSHLRALFDELSIQRRDFAVDLQPLVTSLGGGARESGSISGIIHRGWMDLKAAFASNDNHAILAECERAEDTAAAEYQQALEHDDLPPEVRATVRQQYMAIQSAHDRVRDMRDSFAT